MDVFGRMDEIQKNIDDPGLAERLRLIDVLNKAYAASGAPSGAPWGGAPEAPPAEDWNAELRRRSQANIQKPGNLLDSIAGGFTGSDGKTSVVPVAGYQNAGLNFWKGQSQDGKFAPPSQEDFVSYLQKPMNIRNVDEMASNKPVLEDLFGKADYGKFLTNAMSGEEANKKYAALLGQAQIQGKAKLGEGIMKNRLEMMKLQNNPQAIAYRDAQVSAVDNLKAIISAMQGSGIKEVTPTTFAQYMETPQGMGGKSRAETMGKHYDNIRALVGQGLLTPEQIDQYRASLQNPSAVGIPAMVGMDGGKLPPDEPPQPSAGMPAKVPKTPPPLSKVDQVKVTTQAKDPKVQKAVKTLVQQHGSVDEAANNLEFNSEGDKQRFIALGNIISNSMDAADLNQTPEGSALIAGAGNLDRMDRGVSSAAKALWDWRQRNIANSPMGPATKSLATYQMLTKLFPGLALPPGSSSGAGADLFNGQAGSGFAKNPQGIPGAGGNVAQPQFPWDEQGAMEWLNYMNQQSGR